MATEVKSTLTIIVGAQNDGFTLEAIRPGSIRVEAQPLDLSLVYAHGDTLRLLAKKPQDVGVEKLKALGQTLYKTLFVPDIAEAFAEAERGLERAQDSIRIRIQTSVSEIGRLPWEVMHDGNEFIALRRRIVIVRGMGDVVDDLRTDVGRKLKVLYAWANPGDLPPLELGEPAKQIKGLLRTNNRIQFVVLENASLESLSRSLLDDYHILCFAGHGTAEHLYLEDGDSHERISAQALANKLDAKPTRLVFLAACKAGGRTEDDLPGFAQTLASEAKMPAIAAMQYEVNDDEANLLTARYLEALAKLRPVDVALSEARDAIYEEERVVRDAFSPVLYLQTESSRLFRPDRNRAAIALLALFLVSLLGAALLYRFDPRLTAAQQVAQEEAVTRAAAQERADSENLLRLTAEAASTIESLARSTAQAGATAQAEQKATAIADASIQETYRIIAEEAGQEAKRIALSQELITHSHNYLGSNLPLSLLLAVEADKFAQTNYLTTQAVLLAGFMTYPYLKAFLGNDVRAVAFSPANSVLALKDGDDIVLWDSTSPHSAKLILSVSHDDRNAVQDGLEFDASGRILAVVDGDEVILWDVLAQKEIGRLSNGHTTNIDDVAFSTYRNSLASIDDKGAITLWDVETQSEVQKVSAQQVRLDSERGDSSLSFSPDGRFLASAFGGASLKVLLWDMVEHQVVLEYPSKVSGSKMVFSPEEFSMIKWNVAFSSDGNHLLLGIGTTTPDKATIISVDMEDLGRINTDRQIPYKSPFVPIFDWDGNVTAFISSDGDLYLWNIWSNTEVNRLRYNTTTSGVFLSPYDTLLVSPLHSSYALSDYLTQPYLKEVVFRFGFHVRSVRNEEENIFLLLGNGGEIVRINGETGLSESVSNIDLSYEDYYVLGGEISTELIALHPTNSTLALENRATISFFDLDDNVLRQEGIDLSELSSLTSLEYSPNGKMLASGHEDGTINVWSSMTREHLGLLHGPRSSVRKLIYSPDSTMLAAISLNDFQLYLWDLATFLPIESSINSSEASLVSFSPDSKILAIDYGGSLRFWDIDEASQVALIDPSFMATSMAFDSDGRYLITGGRSGELAIWSLEEERLLDSLDLGVINPEFRTEVTSIDFGTDGSLLLLTLSASRYTDSTIILWDMQSESWRKRACQIANRNLIRSEWQRFFGRELYRETCGNS